MNIEDMFHNEPFGLTKEHKETILLDHLNRLTVHHREHCPPYRNILAAIGGGDRIYTKLEEFPFLPVRLFKEFDFVSVDDNIGLKTLTSSGTTSQTLSKIYLDKRTALYQTKALVNILQSFIGRKRLPMIIVDSPSVLKDSRIFTARGAGVRGISNFGRDIFYFLDDQMRPDFGGLEDFLSRHRGEDILIFGFTFMVWQFFYKALAGHTRTLDMSGAVLVHSGGWKRLVLESVDNMTFKKSIERITGINRIHNFYGMVEQTGSIFVECEHGLLHASNFSDILIRDPLTWDLAPSGQEGVIEVLSILPHSYPGHILLTEDLGAVKGEDDCACGRNGKYFLVSGRIPAAEMRGCSDTYVYEGTAHGL